jgi:hypothetical protein
MVNEWLTVVIGSAVPFLTREDGMPQPDRRTVARNQADQIGAPPLRAGWNATRIAMQRHGQRTSVREPKRLEETVECNDSGFEIGACDAALRGRWWSQWRRQAGGSSQAAPSSAPLRAGPAAPV